MEGTHDTGTWYGLLAQLIEDPQEKRRIAREVGVQTITLQRWISRTSKPREENLRQLIRAVPRSIFQVFVSRVEEEFPGIVRQELAEIDPIATTPPPEFYVHVLNAYATTPPALYPQALYDIILQQVIVHMDPERRGMAVSVVRCMPRVNGKVQSLREVSGRGTSPWPRDLSQFAIFLGAESLAGSAVTRGRLALAQSRNEEYSLFPVHWTEYEECAAAFPIMCRTRVAGCLLISGSVPEMFSEAHLVLLEHYAHLLSLAFESDEFFDLKDISLSLMPKYEDQLAYFHDFRRRVSRLVEEAAAAGSTLPYYEAQQRVWREIEKEFLALSAYREKHQAQKSSDENGRRRKDKQV